MDNISLRSAESLLQKSTATRGARRRVQWQCAALSLGRGGCLSRRSNYVRCAYRITGSDLCGIRDCFNAPLMGLRDQTDGCPEANPVSLKTAFYHAATSAPKCMRMGSSTTSIHCQVRMVRKGEERRLYNRCVPAAPYACRGAPGQTLAISPAATAATGLSTGGERSLQVFDTDARVLGHSDLVYDDRVSKNCARAVGPDQ